MKRILFAILAICLLASPIMVMAESSEVGQITQLLNKFYDDMKGVASVVVKVAPEVIQAQINYLIWGDKLAIIIFGILGILLIALGIVAKVCWDTDIGHIAAFIGGALFLLIGLLFYIDLKSILINPTGKAIEIIKEYVLGK
jgi:hypothetical protein